VIICSIENVDADGVHTGDSITVAPAQTLSDVEYQTDARRGDRLHPPRRCRDRRLERPVRVNPDTGEQVVIEMNPRVSRSSALASKATGFPIAKIAAKLAIGTRSTRSRTTSPRRRRGSRRRASSRASTTS
jgi:carbamoyl-phosphate synthase large subunit